MGELSGRTLSEGAARMFADSLSSFQPDAVLKALELCRRELNRFPTIADVIARIPDGHLGVEEAWALCPKSEEETVVWTSEICHAFTAARALLEDDAIAARMTFKEVYAKELQAARSENRQAKWIVSFGFDKTRREQAILEAVDKKRLPASEVIRYLPLLPDSETKQKIQMLLSKQELKEIEHQI
jgi:hypothetical protein